MKDPFPVNLTPTSEIEARGWVAEARDSDGHLVSTVAWLDCDTTNENLKRLGEFIAEYEPDCAVQVFTGNIASKL